MKLTDLLLKRLKRTKKAQPKAIDLGLPSGTLWADRNVGASSQEGVGLYFSWGNTEGHVFDTDYDFFHDYWNTTGSKLRSDIDEEHDAATVNLGKPWRMPTKDDFIELYENCTYDPCYLNSFLEMKFVGIKFTSNINGKSIFFPCSGYGDYKSFWYGHLSVGYYWSASFNSSRSARFLSFSSGGVDPQNLSYRGDRFVVRPVQNKSD